MFDPLGEMIIRQRTVELNERLDRLYVPLDPEQDTRRMRFLLAALSGWPMRTSAAYVQPDRRATHGVAAK